MRWRPGAVWTAIVMLGAGSRASAQATPEVVRFVTDSATGNQRWEGSVERLTRDSLYLRVRGNDTIAAIPRKAIRALERERLASPGRWAALGCLNLGGALGFLGYAGTHDRDSPGIERRVGLFGLVTGCVVGAFSGAVLSGMQGPEWEAWTFPDDGTAESPNVSSQPTGELPKRAARAIIGFGIVECEVLAADGGMLLRGRATNREVVMIRSPYALEVREDLPEGEPDPFARAT